MKNILNYTFTIYDKLINDNNGTVKVMKNFLNKTVNDNDKLTKYKKELYSESQAS